MSSQRTNGHDPLNADAYPRPPEIEDVRARGQSFGDPRELKIEVSYWPRGEDCGRHYATVEFRCRGGHAEIWDIDSDGALAEQLGAAIVAEEIALGHPAIQTVHGVEDHIDQSRDWICACHEATGEEEPA